MIKNDKQQGTPFVDYTDTLANILALTNVSIGAHAVATNNPTAPFGVYTSGGWHFYTTGSSGGVNPAIQDEGVPLGTPSTYNFVGGGVDVSISGTVIRIHVTGTNQLHNSLQSLQGGTGSQYYHLSQPEWSTVIGLIYPSPIEYIQDYASSLFTGSNNGNISFSYSDPSGTVGVSVVIPNEICEGRLTLESGTSVSSSDQTAKTTIFFTRHNGNRVALYINGGWQFRTLTQVSLSLSGFTTGKNNDIFAYDNAGTLAIERVEWTSDSARATAITLQDGVYVKSGDVTRRYIGTFRTSATGQCEDSISKRYVWNYNSCVERRLQVTASSSHTWVTGTVRNWNADATLRVEFVVGVVESDIFVTILNDLTSAAGASSSAGCIGLGINSTSTMSAISYWASAFRGRSSNNTVFSPTLGYNFVQLLESGLSGVTFQVAQTSMNLKG